MMLALYIVLVLSVVAVLGVAMAVFVRVKKKVDAAKEETSHLRARMEPDTDVITASRE